MINDNTILSSFDDKPTLLEWLKKVEDALKTDTATAVSVENPSANTYVFKITFADGNSISSGNVVFPDSVKDVSIKNGHIIVTSVGGNVEDLGVLNPYADTIVVNAETNTTEIGGKLQVSGEAQVTGNATLGGNLGVTGQAVVGGTLQAGSLQVNSNESVGGGLSVEGALSAKGGITTGGKVTANNGMEVHGQGYVNGSLGLTGNATIGGTITAGGKAIKAVEANPADEATETLEKVKIGDVAYNVGGGGGGGTTESVVITNPSTNRAITLSAGYDSRSFYCDTLAISTNGEKNLGINIIGTSSDYTKIRFEGIGYNKYLVVNGNNSINQYLFISASRARIPDVPKDNGTYMLKATVSGDNLTYSWVLQQ